MAANVIEDLAAGNTIRQDRGYYQVSRHFLVSNVEGSAPSQKAWNAITHPTIPDLYETHPFISLLWVIDREARIEPGSTSTYRVVVNYSMIGSTADFGDLQPDGEPRIEFGSTLVPTRTERAHEEQFGPNSDIPPGIQILVPRQITDGNNEPATDYQPGEVEMMKPQAVVRYMHRRTIDFHAVRNIITQYSGTINRDNAFGDPPHYWLCRIDASSEDGGQTYTMQFEFTRNDISWDPLVTWIDQETGTFLVGATTSNAQGQPDGQIQYRIYRHENFADLGLTL